MGEWTIPGGHLEVDEEPATGAARELEEETGLRAEPGALELFDAAALAPRGGKHVVMLYYVVERAETEGDPVPGSDAADARFLTPSALEESGEPFRPVHEERFRRVVAAFE